MQLRLEEEASGALIDQQDEPTEEMRVGSQFPHRGQVHGWGAGWG